jgi:mono/diheme cytochrome c family protein
MAGVETRSPSPAWTRYVALLSVGAILFVLANSASSAASPSAALSASAKQGQAIFQKNCVTCHNKQPGDTSPFGPPNLHGVFREKLVTPEQAADFITNGHGGMPPFGSVLSKGDISKVIVYLKTL